MECKFFFSPFERKWQLINHDSSLVYMVTHNSFPVCMCRKVCRGLGEGVLDVYKNVPVQF